MIDTHCHLNFRAFKNDYREVISRSFKKGIKALMIVGSNYETSVKAIEIAKEFKNCFVALGLHPIYVKDEKFEEYIYISLIDLNRGIVKAIGETGFDYFTITESQKNSETQKISEIQRLQKDVFLKHLKLAKEFSLPVILHCRGDVNNPLAAYNDLLSIIYNYKPRIYGVIHCFSANWQIAKKFLALGFYIGFTGIITFDNCNSELSEVVKKTPLEKILIETDAPYLAPEPYRGQRCEPWQVKFTAQKISEIKKITSKKVIEQTIKNAKELFRLT